MSLVQSVLAQPRQSWVRFCLIGCPLDSFLCKSSDLRSDGDALGFLDKVLVALDFRASLWISDAGL